MGRYTDLKMPFQNYFLIIINISGKKIKSNDELLVILLF